MRCKLLQEMYSAVVGRALKCIQKLHFTFQALILTLLIYIVEFKNPTESQDKTFSMCFDGLAKVRGGVFKSKNLSVCVGFFLFFVLVVVGMDRWITGSKQLFFFNHLRNLVLLPTPGIVNGCGGLTTRFAEHFCCCTVK